jgi:hypothetical protein
VPIRAEDLRTAAQSPVDPLVKSLNEARSIGVQTAFLCHSHRDATLVRGFISTIAAMGWRLYVDWADTEMPPAPNRVTAERIQKKIVELNYFLFLATPNSMASRWCPWEIGFADGKKGNARIIVIPTSEGGTTYGNEYLQLYRHLDISNLGRLAIWEPGAEKGTRVEAAL